MNLIRRAMVPAGAVLATAGLLWAGASVSHPAAPASSAPSHQDLLSGRSLDALSSASELERLQRSVRSRPDDVQAWAALGIAYVDRARVTGDPLLYAQAEGSLEKSLQLGGEESPATLVGLSLLASARHDFTAALTWGQRARAVGPSEASAEGVVGDALIELGRYRDAFSAFQRMVDAKPNFASYVRVAYARELQGDVGGAATALETALGAAGSSLDAAFAELQLGELHWSQGRANMAVRHYERATALDPELIGPRAGLARAAFFEGRADDAVAQFSELVARFPTPENAAEFGDVLAVSGHPELAAEQYALVGVQRRLLEANGVNSGLEVAVFSADHDTDLLAGLRAARVEWERRSSISVADALSWQLYANGRYQEALGYANKALELGTRNALFHFHRAKIQLALGDREAAHADLAQAASINPNFSVRWSGHAADLLSTLQGAHEASPIRQALDPERQRALPVP